jgi:LuxR family transcriptional regulator, maltose regulon positive regulatory protein
VRTQTPSMYADYLQSGHEALELGDWQTAHDQFVLALQQEVTPQALEGLGHALWWLHDAGPLIETREHAYRLYREQDDLQSAARMSILIALDHYLFRGEHALMSGWFALAHRLLGEIELCPEHAIILIWEGYVVLMSDNNVEAARKLATDATRLAGQLGITDFEVLARALHGLTLVSSGDIAGGMRMLDESTTRAVSGDLTDIDAIVTTCCFLIYACERVRDYDRAMQWCDKVREISVRWNYRFMFSFCRVHYATILLWHGEWDAAERELVAAVDDLNATHPAMAGEAVVRLAELRRRQGRLDDAAALLEQADAPPAQMSSGVYVLIEKAELALDRQQPVAAAELAERFLRRASADALLDRFHGLDVLARSQAALDLGDQAEMTLQALRAVSTSVALPAIAAQVHLCEGRIAAASGDHDVARRRFEDAADLFGGQGARVDAATARLELAHALASLGRSNDAVREARAALEIFETTGAALEVERANALIARTRGGRDSGSGNGILHLTPREIDVLTLVAQGLTDKEIAQDLGLSEHTIHRHVGNILTRLDVPSRTAAVAVAARNGLI